MLLVGEENIFACVLRERLHKSMSRDLFCLFFYDIAAPQPFLQHLSSVSRGDYFYFAEIAMVGYGSPQKCIAACFKGNVKSERRNLLCFQDKTLTVKHLETCPPQPWGFVLGRHMENITLFAD